MPELINIDLLPDELRNAVRSAWRQVMKRETYLMTTREAARLYGYKPRTIDALCRDKRIKAIRRRKVYRITHQAMREYISTKQAQGRPRMNMKRAQLHID